MLAASTPRVFRVELPEVAIIFIARSAVVIFDDAQNVDVTLQIVGQDGWESGVSKAGHCL
jgi:hypothetical protein